MKSFLLASLVVLSAPLGAVASPDSDWKQVQDLIDAAPGLIKTMKSDPSNAESLETLEIHLRDLRAQGLQFYQQHSNDKRWLDWFGATLGMKPSYWKDPADAADEVVEIRKSGGVQKPNIEVDQKALDAWNNKDFPALRQAYLSSNDVTNVQKASFRLGELNAQLMPVLLKYEEGVGVRQARDPKVRDMCKTWMKDLLAIAKTDFDWTDEDSKENKKAGGDLEFLTDSVFNAFPHDPETQDAMINDLKASPNKLLQKYGAAKERLAALRTTPWEMKFTDLNGQEVDLAKLRGKPVIVEYWDLGCRGCIGQIPKLKAWYDKYHEQGLQIIGTTAHKEDLRLKLKRYVRDKEIAWPQRMDRDQHKAEFDGFGFQWVSNMLLFDAEGKLVRVEASPDTADWERIIREQLKLPAEAEKAAAAK